ncbi:MULTISPECIES: SHOCT domain-containing protein [Bacillota]|jgi:hypothetical protein|uniref:SHOCT-like domain-containing protein n=2 Tax=Bacillota TaxID=1239 RepID=A0A0K8J6H1_9FIRM|nr:MULTISPECIES: SHOCT domain-containing protein [Bacillota]RSU13271.1 hypothetical protein CBF27_03555 [Vagococcus acidifermentans]CUH93004.1 hypothetical protein SD1D_1458 [Herbinix luporum]
MKENPNLEFTQLSNKQLEDEVSYFIAQKLLSSLLDKGLISTTEYQKITFLNRSSFSPILAAIMPETLDISEL